MELTPNGNILQMVLDFREPIKTPIFEAKISMDKMLNHLADKQDGFLRRIELINLVKPTLEKPLFITEEENRYKFVKTFIDDSDKTIKFLSVIEDEKGEFLGITITKLKNTDLKNLIKGNIIWGGDTLSELSTPQIAKNKGSEAMSDIIPQSEQKDNKISFKIHKPKPDELKKIDIDKFDGNDSTAINDLRKEQENKTESDTDKDDGDKNKPRKNK